MSTKFTIAHSDTFHFYEDFEDNNLVIHLDIEDEAGYRSVSIPLHIWEAIRNYDAVDFSICEKSNMELESTAREFIARRIEDCNGDLGGLMGARGAFSYGFASDPIEEQVKNGVAALKARREWATDIKIKRDAILKDFGIRLRVFSIADSGEACGSEHSEQADCRDQG